MKSRQSLLLLLTVCLYILPGTSKLFAYDGGVYAHEPAHHLLNASYWLHDTTPKKGTAAKEALKEAGEKVVDASKEAATEAAKKIAENATKIKIPEDPVKDAGGLFKKVADLFKFRKNNQEKEKKRIVEIIKGLDIDNAIAATSQNLELLMKELSDRENQHFDSLLAIINTIRINAEKEAEARAAEASVPVNKKEDPLDADPSQSKMVSDKDIEDLTNKLLPLINEKVKEDNTGKDKREALRAIRQLKVGAGEVNYIVDTVNQVVKRFKLSVKNKAEVIGLHNYTSNDDYADYKLGYLNTLVYQSLFVNGKTGNIKDLNGWDSAEVISDALAEGCDVYFTAAIEQSSSIATFLESTAAQKKFLDNTLFLLKQRNATGVNIHFTQLPGYLSNKFTDFIKFLSEVLTIENSNYKVMITIPVYDHAQAYDMLALSEYVHRFMIDFGKLPPVGNGALAPLFGKNDYSIETAVSRYLNTDIPAEKLIVSIPYAGTRWQLARGEKKGRFIQTLTYSEIRKRYPWPVYYDDQSGSAVIDSLNREGVTIRRIIFDDDVSLEKKYDFILQSGLGGVSINSLGYDKGYGDLWDMLAYKFAIIDTTYLSDSLINVPLNMDLGFFERARRKWALYWYILNNPCQVCFEDESNPEHNALLNRYILELKIDSLIETENSRLKPEERYKSRFEYVNYELTTILIYSSIIFFLLLLLATGFYIYHIKVNSSSWKWKKHMESILIGLTLLFVITIFTYLFCDDTLPMFGSSPVANANYEITATPVRIEEQLTDTTAIVRNLSYCDTDPTETCVNMPLHTLMTIIVSGMVAGLLITRFLILPLIKRDDIP